MKRDFLNDRDDHNKTAVSNSIIKQHIGWSTAAGAIPVFLVDAIAVTAIQVDMVKQLSRVYDVDFDEMTGKTIVTSLVGASSARLGASAIKAIPFFGSIGGAFAMSMLSGASTYALGQVFKQHFETGGTFLDFDTNRLRKYYSEQFEKGKKVAQDIKTEEDEKKKQAEAKAAEDVKTTKKKAKPKVKVVKEDNIDSMDAALQKLQDLSKLRDDGVITEAEFQKMKKKMMDKF